MSNQTTNSKSIFRLNWFTFLVLFVLAFVFIQKDLSLKFDLNAPLKMESESPDNYEMPSQKTTTKKKKRDTKLTEKAPAKVAEINESRSSLFNFFGGSSQPKKLDLKAELDKIDEATKQGYLKRFAHVALNEQSKFGIPASIILANGLLHSLGGRRNLAVDYQNHFAVTCDTDWAGETGSLNGVCYRKYETAWMSFRNHSLYITSGKFSDVVKNTAGDYKKFAHELERLKYSPTQNLAKNLIKIIEQYGLNDLDNQNT